MKPNKDPLKNEEERKDRSRSSYSELPEDDDSSPTKASKKEPKKATKDIRELRILKRSKTLKEKNDPERFCGDGVNFKSKIIGIEHVFDARGNRMCQGALQRLKAAVKTSGDHKQRIILNISLCGIKIKDEKTGEVLHHHPIHKISFISQDTSDSRAFGYVFGCPQTGHRFFAIKTEKTASQVVVTLRDLFHTALELKKQEMERAMDGSAEDQPEQIAVQNGESEVSFNGITESASNGAFGDSSFSRCEQEIPQELLYLNTVMLPEETEVPRNSDKPSTEVPSAVDNLLDLQFEMDSLQQGITQMECSMASVAAHGFGFSFSEDDVSVSSGSSFPMTPRKIDRLSSIYQETLSMSSRSSSTSDYNVCSQDKPEDPEIRSEVSATTQSPKTVQYEEPSPPPPEPEPQPEPKSQPAPEPVEDRYAVFLEIDSLPSIFDSPNVVNPPGSSKDYSGVVYSNDVSSDTFDSALESSLHAGKTSTPVVFAELDPLGNHPYIDKKNFFQDIKNPPKKVLKDYAENSSEFSDSFSECDVPPAYTESSSSDGVPFNPFIGSNGVSYPHTPPKLPPKRSASIASPLTFIPAVANDGEITSVESNAAPWDVKNPFNPFVEEFEDMPPPSSPPPPPPPRFPLKSSEPPPMSPPPPRPPSRSNGVPTPPLPKRKPPLAHSGRAWFSFDQEATAYSATQEIDSSPDFFAPPIPAPSRKLPNATSSAKLETSILKSCSASSSPATVRRLQNQSPSFGAPSFENPRLFNGTACSPKKILSRHSSIAQECPDFRNDFFETDFTKEPTTIADYAEAIEALNRSPPLPPKPSSIARPRPSPSKKMLSTPSTASRSSSNASNTETTNGTCSSSSLMYSSMEDSKHGSGTEGLLLSSTGSQSEVPFSSSNEVANVKPSVSSPVSPDSIFQRKDDPFADDFFLTLPKKSGNSEPCAITNTLEEQCSNGVEVHLEHL